MAGTKLHYNNINEAYLGLFDIYLSIKGYDKDSVQAKWYWETVKVGKVMDREYNNNHGDYVVYEYNAIIIKQWRTELKMGLAFINTLTYNQMKRLLKLWMIG